MKSAYELAIERLGGGGKSLSDAQKKDLADIDRVYDAKVAEARLAFEARLKSLDDAEEQREKAREELSVELGRLERKRESEKDAVRRRAG